MTILYLRNYSSYIELARVFGCKENTAQDTFSRVLNTIRMPLLDAFIRPLRKQAQLTEGSIIEVDVFRCQVLAISTSCTHCGLFVSNKQSHWSGVWRKKGLLFWQAPSIWHQARASTPAQWLIYCAYILGAVAFVSDPYPGVRHDFILFQASVAKYREFLEKEPGDEFLDDPDRIQDQ